MPVSGAASYYTAFPLLFLLSTQTGCLIYGSADYFSNSADERELQLIAETPAYRRDHVQRAFHMEIDGTRLRGWLEQSTTGFFTFLPGISILMVGHNPYHLELLRRKGECPQLKVMSVNVDDLEGNTLFRTEAGEDMLTTDGQEEGEWIRVLKWGDALARIPWHVRQVKVCIEYMSAELLDQNSPAETSCATLERQHFRRISGLGGD